MMHKIFGRNPPAQPARPERIVRLGCPAHNCGGRCLLVAHMRDDGPGGRPIITRLEADDRPDDTLAAPQLRACPRGRAYLRRQYHPDRLLYPMQRTGPRGEGRFERISWDQALHRLASEMQRVKAAYGNSALFVPYGTGSYNQTSGAQVARRLMNLFGGCLGYYNSYSWGAINIATPYVYGTLQTGNQRQDWVNAKYILMWGWNPAEMRDGTNSDYFVKEARRAGARVVCIDPRLSLSAASLADEWVPVRPGTDAALMSAMAYVIITEGLYDAGFVSSHCIGFDRSQMPPGLETAESYSDYILGRCDGQPKTPDWAEPITAIPAATTARLAREYATTRPAVLYQGYGMQRRAYGEQAVLAGCALAAITGNVGISGGWASGLGLQAPDGGPFWNLFPAGENPVKATIPVFLWTEAVLRGAELTAQEGVLGADRLESSIKLIYAVASNALINQHANINRTAEILRDERRVEFIAVQDQFLTPTARFADLILPACTQFETYGCEDGWKYGDEVLLMPQVLQPPGEARSDYAICADLAERLGIGPAFTEGRDERGWTGWLIERYRETRFPEIPALDEFEASNVGVHAKPVTQPAVAFADFRRDPEAHPLPTPSGKIELFSARLYEKKDALITPVPKYIQEWESPFGPQATEYPLQALGHHTLHRVHSTHDNVDWLEEAFPQRVFINPLDAAPRGIEDGDLVRVFNARGAMLLPCRLTQRILPGVVDIPQGAWWTPDKDGVDRRGSINVLTSERWTPLAFATAQHTIMVQVERAPTRERSRHVQPAAQAVPRPQAAPLLDLPATPGVSQYAFHFDASACSGCKACQIACKDKHGLEVGRLWRRVYEVQGGEWRQANEAWQPSVFAYNISLGCNHCQQPACRDACPAGAIVKRGDGVVLIDPDKCIGCGYCHWACPYEAPQLDPLSGTMTKCTFCADLLSEGKPPACVAACPMRALDFGEQAELTARYGVAGHLRPLPDPSLTRPAIVITPHPAALRSQQEPGHVANREEVAPT